MVSSAMTLTMMFRFDFNRFATTNALSPAKLTALARRKS